MQPSAWGAMGHDVVAASDDPVLAVLPDEELLRAASNDARAVVTENAKDFDRIARAWAAADEHHRGIIFTSPRRFARNHAGVTDNGAATGEGGG